ncbi:MAG TPA: ATP-binding protein [Bacteroidales bacterium]|nr:ATP-binding protein [Bacteroidales bacterium]HSA43870.1 ATP-binding protein [Bacteroidales bacterium]
MWLHFVNIYHYHRKVLSPLWLVLLFLFGWGFCHDLAGQRIHSFQYTEADGLSSSNIQCITQDTNGLIWLASGSGISSYNGIGFTHYNQRDGLPVEGYRFIYKDETGRLWAVPQQGHLGFYYLDGRLWKLFEPVERTDSDYQYSCFDVTYQDDNEILAVGTKEHGARIFKDKKWYHVDVEHNGLPDKHIFGILCQDDYLFIVSGKKMLRYRISTLFENSKPEHVFDNAGVLQLAVAQQYRPGKPKDVYVLGDQWIGMLDGEEIKLFACQDKFRLALRNYPFFLSTRDGERFMFGSDYSIYRFDKGRKAVEFISRNRGLIAEGATSVLVDREDNTWICSRRGISRIASWRFLSFSVNEGLPESEVSSGIEISPDSYVFGHHGKMSYLKGNAFIHLNLNEDGKLPDYEARILDISIDKERNLWVAASELGLARVSPGRSVRWFRESEGLRGRTNSVVVSPEQEIFVSTTEGLFQYHQNRFRQVVLNKIPPTSIRKLFNGRNGSLYIATIKDGVFEKRGEMEADFSAAGSPLANNVYSFFMDNKQTRWVGTADGLFFISGSSLVSAEKRGIVLKRPVYVITQDKRSQLWFGTDNGVYRYTGSRLEHFTTRDGLSGLDINRSAGFTDSDGNVWFGTNNGLSLFRAEFDYHDSLVVPPLVSILFFTVGEDTLSSFISHSLSHQNNDLVFKFQVLSFLDEKRVYFQCKLEGFDADWSKSFTNYTDEYRYSNLPAGKYRFCIRAWNSLGTMSETVCSDWIRVKQPLWRQFWFLALVFLLLAGILLFLSRYFLVKRYSHRLEVLVSRRTEMLEQSQKQLMESNAAKDSFISIIAHDLRSPFNSLLGFLDILITDYGNFSDKERLAMLGKLRELAGRTFKLLENLLTWARAERNLLPFEPQVLNISELIDEVLVLLEPIALEKDVTVRYDSEENLMVKADRNMLETVIRNLVSNAVKYSWSGGGVAISNKKDGKGDVVVSVTDQGTGISDLHQQYLFSIDRRITAKGTKNETGTGMGLILCKEFVERNGGRIWVTSEAGKGSAFYFTVPGAS